MSKNTVTLESIVKILDEAETQEQIFWDKELVVSYRLKCGFTITGHAKCVDPANFVLETGRGLARKDAEKKLWEFEGYSLQKTLYTLGIL